MSEQQSIGEQIATSLERFADSLERGDEINLTQFYRAQADIKAGRTRPIHDVIAELEARLDATQELANKYRAEGYRDPQLASVIEADLQSLRKDIRRLSDRISELHQREAT